MKDIASNRSFFSNVGKPCRAPLRTFREFAEEFGVSEGVLRRALADEGSPKPELMQSNSRTTRNRWYKTKEMRTWWTNRAQK